MAQFFLSHQVLGGKHCDFLLSEENNNKKKPENLGFACFVFANGRTRRARRNTIQGAHHISSGSCTYSTKPATQLGKDAEEYSYLGSWQHSRVDDQEAELMTLSHKTGHTGA